MTPSPFPIVSSVDNPICLLTCQTEALSDLYLCNCRSPLIFGYRICQMVGVWTFRRISIHFPPLPVRSHSKSCCRTWANPKKWRGLYHFIGFIRCSTVCRSCSTHIFSLGSPLHLPILITLMKFCSRASKTGSCSSPKYMRI